jgi:diguanylate cyclase (GGDEF)-like protein
LVELETEGGVRDVASPDHPDSPFRVLSDVVGLLARESDLSRLLESIADAIVELIPCDSLILYQADLPLRQLRPVLVRDAHAEQILLYGICAFGEGITGAAAERQQAVLCNDIDLDPRARNIPGTPIEEESLMTVPLVAGGELKGMLNMYREGRGNWFTESELDLARRFADMSALALDNAQIRTRLEAESITDPLTGLYNHRYFQERLAEEMRRSGRTRRPVSLVLIDIDDFKRINEQDGHLSGDRVLAGLATVMREQARQEDVICRVGGEEFAMILPGTFGTDAQFLAERLKEEITQIRFNGEGTTITVSMGVAEGPAHATGPRELMACANLALLQAKGGGKDRVASYVEGEWSGVRAVPRHEFRMAAHLKLLQAVAGKLNRLQDVRRIGEAVLQELKGFIDYHNCRVHLLDRDGRTLRPIAFRGELSEYQGETEEALITEVGRGITGRVAETGEPIYAADAAQCEFAINIPGTPEVEESIMTVPLKFDERVIGTIAVSRLGIDQFDADDLRILEVLASHAAVALENARLFEEERQSAETANALLRVSQALTRTNDPRLVLKEVVGSLANLLGLNVSSAWLREADGFFRCRASYGYSEADRAKVEAMEVPPDLADRHLLSMVEPFYLPVEVVEALPPQFRLGPTSQPTLVAPFRWSGESMGALVALGNRRVWTFSPRDFRLARGIADLASLAMGNAHRFADLERAFLQTVQVLANALEAKDQYTRGHAHEVAAMATELGAHIGLSGDDLRTLELAALFHDIGKIGVGTEIINKPGSLTEEEMAEMRKHPGIGSTILAPVEFLQPVRPLVEASHEWWNGEGYPEGLSGDQIPLGARIISVCDAYHAMISDRSYRKALGQKEAVRRLDEAAGSQFDPIVVRVFKDLVARGLVPEHDGGHHHH